MSVTTRARRSDEVEGTHYYFVDVPTFERMRAEGELLESAKVHDNFYGTPRAKVEEQLAAGNDILFDIDYQGTLQLYEKSRADMVTVFILPPTDQGTARPPRTPRPGQCRHHRKAPAQCQARNAAFRRIRLHHHQ